MTMNNVSCPQPVLDLIPTLSSLKSGRKTLLILFGQLGDFDSIEYAQIISTSLPRINSSDIQIFAIGIGNDESRKRFCRFTNFPEDRLITVNDPTLHSSLGLSKGLQLFKNPLLNLLLMCIGLGSPGTIQEVFRGYLGDNKSKQLLTNQDTVNIRFLPFIKSSLFTSTFGDGYLRPFELASIRLNNMIEILSNWKIYMPTNKYLTQRGATYFIDIDNTLLYKYKSQALLDYSLSKQNPLVFLEPYIL